MPGRREVERRRHRTEESRMRSEMGHQSKVIGVDPV